MRFLLLGFFLFSVSPPFFFPFKGVTNKAGTWGGDWGCVSGLSPSLPAAPDAHLYCEGSPRPPRPDVTQERRPRVAFRSWGHRSAPLPQPSQCFQGWATPTSPRGDTAPLSSLTLERPLVAWGGRGFSGLPWGWQGAWAQDGGRHGRHGGPPDPSLTDNRGSLKP